MSDLILLFFSWADVAFISELSIFRFFTQNFWDDITRKYNQFRNMAETKYLNKTIDYIQKLIEKYPKLV